MKGFMDINHIEYIDS